MIALSVKEVVKAVKGKLLYGDEKSLITSVSTNSKEINSGALFVPLIGERVDAHQFIDGAVSLGAIAVFTSKHKDADGIMGDCAYIQVEDTLTALQVLGAYYRDKFTIPFIGITGSVGKTTTKEMIAAALETKFKVIKTIGNMNSQVGLPLMMFHIEPEHEIAVIEMGMSEEGEMERLARIAKPNIAVMTNIGVSHIGQLKTQENIRKEKLNIINEFRDGHLFINGDDILLRQLKEATDEVDLCNKTKDVIKNTTILTYGMNQCDYEANDLETKNNQTYFRYVKDGEAEDVVLNVLGTHNVQNAIVAIAIANMLGVSPNVSKKGLKAYAPIAMRGQIYESNGMKIIDDTYNASPDSMKGGVDVLCKLDNVKRKIAVLADSLELGEYSYKCHYDVGTYVGENNIEILVTIGMEAKAIGEGALAMNKNITYRSFESNEEAIAYLESVMKIGDAILVKGSRGMHTEKIVEALR